MIPSCSSSIKPDVCRIDEFEFLTFESVQDLSYFSIWDRESRDAKDKQKQQENSQGPSKGSITKRGATTKRTLIASKRNYSKTSSACPTSIKKLKPNDVLPLTEPVRPAPTRISQRQLLQRTKSNTTSTATANLKKQAGDHVHKLCPAKKTSTTKPDNSARAARALKQTTKSNQHGPVGSSASNKTIDIFAQPRKYSNKMINKRVIKNTDVSGRRRSNRKLDDGEFRDGDDKKIDQMEKEIRNILAGKKAYSDNIVAKS